MIDISWYLWKQAMSRFICLHVDVQLFQYHLLKRLSLLAKYVLLDFLLLMGEVFLSFFFLVSYIDEHVTHEKDDLIFSFPICIHSISFYCFIALARTSNTMLKRCGKREHPCLVSDFGENIKLFTRVVNIWSIYILRRSLGLSDFYSHPSIFK